MRIKTFFENFELLAEAPNAVGKLREIILQLAVCGKLVPQNLSDEPASASLEKADQEKGTLFNVVNIKEDEQLFPLPKYWKWAYFERVLKKIHYGYTASANSNIQDVRLLRITDIQDNKVDWSIVPGCEIKEYELEKFVLNEGDLLIARTGGTIGKSYLVESLHTVAVFASYLIRAIPCSQVYPRYLKLFLDSSLYWKQLYAKSMGTGQPNVNATSLKSLTVPIPPLAEQKRIVEKCDRLMSLCDQIEVRQQKQQESIVRMNESAIAQLLSSQNPDEFRQHWQGICNNFDLLYSIPETIPKLRQAILQLAVQGKLVRQNPNDEPAPVLLEKIRAEKERAILGNKFKRSKSLFSIKQDEEPYSLPIGWKWAKVSDVCFQVTDGVHSTPSYTNSGVPFLSVNNLKNNKISFDGCKYISLDDHIELARRCKPEFNDILLGKVGSIGVCDVITTKEEFSIFVQLALLKIVQPFIDSFYIKYIFLSEAIKQQISAGSAGSALQYIGIGKIQSLVIPIPPLAEQKRIVAKVDRLMSLCDVLEAKLKEARSYSETLMEVVAKQVLIA